jgi:hypothetical protein
LSKGYVNFLDDDWLKNMNLAIRLVKIPFIEERGNIGKRGIVGNIAEYQGISGNISEYWGVSRNIGEYWGLLENIEECWGETRNIVEDWGIL